MQLLQAVAIGILQYVHLKLLYIVRSYPKLCQNSCLGEYSCKHSQLRRLSGPNSSESVCNKILKHLKLQQLNKPVSFCVLNMNQTTKRKSLTAHD